MAAEHWISRTGAQGHSEGTQLPQSATSRTTCADPGAPQVGKKESRRLTDRQLRRVSWLCFLAAGLVVILTAAFETGALR